MFWTDINQARDRLEGSYFLLGNDPVYFERIREGETRVTNYRTGQAGVLVSLEDFGDFRKLPPLGWVNWTGGAETRAFYLYRVPMRNRQHGLSSNNCNAGGIENDLYRSRSNRVSFDNVLTNDGYLEAVDGIFPEPGEILEHLQKGQEAAFSMKYAISCDSRGLFWLWRKTDCLGLILKDSIRLLPGQNCYRDELAETRELATFQLGVL